MDKGERGEDGMKTFRDPVHNIIQFDKVEERLLLDLIDAPEFQRLHHIKQLGFSFLTYPGAEHTRFSHSLGVVHLMKRFLDKIIRETRGEARRYAEELKERRLLALAAALLHDIGHGPFSHALEKTTHLRHEHWTIAIILGNTMIHQILETYRTGFAQEVADVIQRTHSSRAVVKLLSSQLDVDRMDYLLRDAQMTGAGYGRFDLEWLIHTLRIGEMDGEVQVGLDREKGLSIAEDFIMARYYMFVHVYLHKTTRSAELMIEKIFERAVELEKKGEMVLPEELSKLLSKREAS
ncbi:MAG: HD domain-containing protein, partial [Thermicanus sp.]|nr:HD domain-containing protein [Thermicanus sp.]